MGLFNRDGSQQPVTKSVDFVDVLGLQAAGQVRDLWAHEDLGSMTGWKVALGPYTSSLVKVTPTARAHYEAEVGAWSGTARFDNLFDGYEGFGYVTGLDTPGAGVTRMRVGPYRRPVPIRLLRRQRNRITGITDCGFL